MKDILHVLVMLLGFSPQSQWKGCPRAVNLYDYLALFFSKHWISEECQNNDIETVSESWRSLPATAQVPLPSADVLAGWAAPKVTVTLSSAICPVVCPESECMFFAEEQLEDGHVCSATFYIKQK